MQKLNVSQPINDKVDINKFDKEIIKDVELTQDEIIKSLDSLFTDKSNIFLINSFEKNAVWGFGQSLIPSFPNTNSNLFISLFNSVLGGLDMGALCLELGAIFIILLARNCINWLGQLTSSFQLELVVLSQHRNISLGECAALITPVIGAILFDFVAALSEEDIFDNAGLILLIGLGLGAMFVLLLVDIQYFFTASAASSSEITLRLIYTDFINNLLCCTRVIFCWIRYLFYELQSELVDMTLFYAETGDSTQVGYFFNDLSSNDSQGWLLSNLTMLGLNPVQILGEITLILIQTVFSAAKLGLALYLYWLIFDLLILRSLAHAELIGTPVNNNKDKNNTSSKFSHSRRWQWVWPFRQPRRRKGLDRKAYRQAWLRGRFYLSREWTTKNWVDNYPNKV